MPSRRAALRSLLSAVVVGSSTLAGCIDGASIHAATGERPSTDEPSAIAETTEPPETPYSGGECDAVEKDSVDPDRDSVEPKPLPVGPPTDDDLPGTWVADYERVYLYNSNLTADTKRASVDVGYVDVERLDGGFLVSVESEYHYEEQSVTTGNATATAIVGHSGLSTRTYFGNGLRLVRADGEFSSVSAVFEAGLTLECWPRK